MKAEQQDLPIQPVNKPILCSPFAEPTAHWVYRTDTGEPYRHPDRRPASYWYKTQATASAQMSLFAEGERDELPLVNALRADVKAWREKGWDGASTVTRELLRHWTRDDRLRRLFFCQLEAVETILYLQEILEAGRKLPRQNMALARLDYDRLRRGEKTTFEEKRRLTVPPRLLDRPNEPGLPSLLRYGCKMATGSGKTVVMAMLIAWAFCNRGRGTSRDRYASAVLVVCPNLTIKERLQVLRPDNPENYYQAFDLVPSQLMPELAKGKVLVTNWHGFLPESPHAEGGKSYVVVNKGEESPEAFGRRVLGDLYDRGPLLVLNDEAHHAYRPAPVGEHEKLSAEEKAEREEATVWISGLDRLNQACGVLLTVDLSATPFYLTGSGYIEGSPFPWLVSDFGLVDAIESGIVKIPRLPVSDTTGRPEPKYFALWRHICDNLQPGEKLPGGKPKPDVVWREAEDALATLMGQWKERFEYFEEAAPGQERVPPVMIVVCDNTDIAAVFAKNISGEETVEVVSQDPEDEDEEEGGGRRKKSAKAKTKTMYGTGKLFGEYFSNGEGRLSTLRIDSKLLAKAESEDPTASRSDAAEQLREIVSTVGKFGKPGEQVRCVVSVQMLSEGWDANNVTHILGLRAFGSQLLCEQVIGRGLRRMDYTVDPETGLLTEEYVDVYGVPFSIVPFKGRKTGTPTPVDRPKNHVHALDERRHFEIRFPVVEGFAFALRSNFIRADVGTMEAVTIEPNRTPTAVFVKPQVGHQTGSPKLGGFDATLQDRQEYYDSQHLQTIQFEIARRVVWILTEGVEGRSPKLKLRSRHQLFPQVYRLVEEYVARKVNWNGQDRRELGLETYVQRIVERFIDAIEPDESQGEPPLLPILNRYKPIGSTGEVNFKTTRSCCGTQRSHINQVVLDTATWEQSAAFRLEQASQDSGPVAFYARNDHMECTVPYEYLGASHVYIPDYLVRLKSGLTLFVEIKGFEDDQTKAKHQAARRWVSAVNNWGKLGTWGFHVCRNPQVLGKELAAL